MTRLKHQQLLAGEVVDFALDLIDAAKNILKRPGVIDRGAYQPDLGERQADQEHHLTRGRHGRDAREEGRQGCRGDGYSSIQRSHAERDQGVQDPVFIHQDVDLPLGRIDGLEMIHLCYIRAVSPRATMRAGSALVGSTAMIWSSWGRVR